MSFKNFYQTMEVESTATQEEIKSAYHRLARKYHPDISTEPNAELRFKEISEAYEALKDPKKRATYNATFKIIKPYTYAWLRAKREKWTRAWAQKRARRNADARLAKAQERSKKMVKNVPSIQPPIISYSDSQQGALPKRMFWQARKVTETPKVTLPASEPKAKSLNFFFWRNTEKAVDTPTPVVVISNPPKANPLPIAKESPLPITNASPAKSPTPGLTSYALLEKKLLNILPWRKAPATTSSPILTPTPAFAFATVPAATTIESLVPTSSPVSVESPVPTSSPVSIELTSSPVSAESVVPPVVESPVVTPPPVLTESSASTSSASKPSVATPPPRQQRKVERKPFMVPKEEERETNSYSFRIILILLLIIAIISSYFGLQEFNKWQSKQELGQAIILQDEMAIATFEKSEVNVQQTLLQENKPIKNALLTFYLQHTDGPIFSRVEAFAPIIQTELLQDEKVYQTLRDHYYRQIDQETEVSNFTQAFQTLAILQNKYPNTPELEQKYEEVYQRKQQRLAKLTEKYMTCLEQTLAPLLDRTHCMADARKQIEEVGIEHHLPNDSNLPVMYLNEVQQAMTEKNYTYAEKVLLDWQQTLPESSPERDALQAQLQFRLQFDSIVADLSSQDHTKIVYWLNQLERNQEIQKEILALPQVQNSLLEYHLAQTLDLLGNYESVKVTPYTLLKLKRVISSNEQPNKPASYLADAMSPTRNVTSANPVIKQPPPPRFAEVTPPMAGSSAVTRVTTLLRDCQKHYDAKRFTTGSQGTALDCYQTVLRFEPANRQAINSLQEMERSYVLWAESALQQKNFEKAKGYLAGLRKINPRSKDLTRLKQRLKDMQIVAQTPKSVPVERVIATPRFAKPTLERSERAVERPIERSERRQQADREERANSERVESRSTERAEKKSSERAEKKSSERAEKKSSERAEKKPSERAEKKSSERAEKKVADRSDKQKNQPSRTPRQTETPRRQPRQVPAVCATCACSPLVRQLSLGLKPLTAEESQFFQSQCNK
jgi:hypothetical protein